MGRKKPKEYKELLQAQYPIDEIITYDELIIKAWSVYEKLNSLIQYIYFLVNRNSRKPEDSSNIVFALCRLTAPWSARCDTGSESSRQPCEPKSSDPFPAVT